MLSYNMINFGIWVTCKL